MPVPHYLTPLGGILSTVSYAGNKPQCRPTQRQKGHYDLRVSVQIYKENALFWIMDLKRKRGVSAKLQQKYKGMYRVVNRVSWTLYELSPILQIHDRLTPYLGPDPTEAGPRQ